MKQWAKFQVIFLFSVTFYLLFSLPAQVLPKTNDDIEYKINEIDYEFGVLGDDMIACKKECDRLELEILDLENRGVAPPFGSYDFIVTEWDCDYKQKLDELGKGLDELANPGANVTVSEQERKKIEELKVKLDELRERNDNIQKRRQEFEERIKKLEEAAKNSVHSETASEIIKIMKPVLEKVCGGQLEVQVLWDKIERNIRVISIDFGMEEGKRLDDNFYQETDKGLREVGIFGKVVGNSYRADGGVKIAGMVTNSFQIVASEDTIVSPQDIEGEALATLVVNKIRIALTVSFLENKVKKY